MLGAQEFLATAAMHQTTTNYQCFSRTMSRDVTDEAMHTTWDGFCLFVRCTVLQAVFPGIYLNEKMNK